MILHSSFRVDLTRVSFENTSRSRVTFESRAVFPFVPRGAWIFKKFYTYIGKRISVTASYLKELEERRTPIFSDILQCTCFQWSIKDRWLLLAIIRRVTSSTGVSFGNGRIAWHRLRPVRKTRGAKITGKHRDLWSIRHIRKFRSPLP